MNMKWKFLLIAIMIYLKGFGQTISNVDAWQDGRNIVISYDLTEEPSGEKKLFQHPDSYLIWVYCSIDGGEQFFCIDHYQTGTGYGKSGSERYWDYPGEYRTIVWDVLKDINTFTFENVVFKVRAWKKGSYREHTDEGEHIDLSSLSRYYSDRASDLMRSKKYAEAIVEYEKALSINKNNFNDYDWSYLAECKARLGDFKGAKEASKNYIADEKSDIIEIFGDVVKDTYWAKDYEKTIELAPKALEMGASDICLEYGGKAAFHLKKYELCLTFLEDYLKSQGSYAYMYKPDLGYFLGVAYEATGNNAKAYEYYTAFYSKNKKYKVLHEEELEYTKQRIKVLKAQLK